jgi:hypothetical protein
VHWFKPGGVVQQQSRQGSMHFAGGGLIMLLSSLEMAKCTQLRRILVQPPLASRFP